MSDRLSLPFLSGQIEMPDGPVLVLRAAGAEVFREFEDLSIEQDFKLSFDRLTAQGYSNTSNHDDYACVIVQITRDKSENLGLIAKAQKRVAMGGTVLIDGNKTDGIDSLYKTLRKTIGDMPTVTKSHGRAFWWIKSADQTMPDWDDALSPSKQAHGFYTHAGMFSADKVDDGSALLAGHLDNALGGKVADLGAGWGWLSAQALKTNPKIDSLDLYESEDSALRCARLNIEDPRAVFHWADVTSMATPRAYDAIIMNPPFHQSRRADPSLGKKFIAAAGKLLRPKGRLYMVANRQLAYEDTLTASFGSWDNIEETNRFKVFRARNPKTAR